MLSGLNIRSIRSYEQGQNELSKAQGDTLLMLAKTLDCTIEDLLK
ncbi:MAG: helix-turn-helix domain-containing protein [Acholeplasmatales bacterium]|nr:helix-turn-helix domain-containing protein [Acholeplasmatales bacterium]